jgi:MFS transporter, FHS family, L-fucose permease
MMKNNNSYKLPLALVFSLFFLWAISSNLLPTMIRQLMKTCELNTFEASFTETAYWLAYFIFPIPIAMFMKRYSYKAGIIFGLVLAAAGGLLFFPAAMLKEYWAYLCIFFVIATGMCFLETAANPYVTALGDAATAPQRLNLAQSFNGLGAFIAAMFLSKLILSGTHYTRETLPADYPGGWEAYIQFETDAMKTPYLALAVLLLVIAGIFIFSRLPKIGHEERNAQHGIQTNPASTHGNYGTKQNIHQCIDQQHILRTETNHQSGTNPSSQQESQHIQTEIGGSFRLRNSGIRTAID